mgnify:CR=1 FL=1
MHQAYGRNRYAYGRQASIAQWNLARFAETLLPLIDANSERAIAAASAVIEAFPEQHNRQWLTVMRAKLGLDDTGDAAVDHYNCGQCNRDRQCGRGCDRLWRTAGRAVDVPLLFLRWV